LVVLVYGYAASEGGGACEATFSLLAPSPTTGKGRSKLKIVNVQAR